MRNKVQAALSRCYQAAADLKAAATVEFLLERLDALAPTGGKVLFFGHHKSLLVAAEAGLRAAGHDFAMITGAVAASARQAAVGKFQAAAAAAGAWRGRASGHREEMDNSLITVTGDLLTCLTRIASSPRSSCTDLLARVPRPRACLNQSQAAATAAAADAGRRCCRSRRLGRG